MLTRFCLRAGKAFFKVGENDVKRLVALGRHPAPTVFTGKRVATCGGGDAASAGGVRGTKNLEVQPGSESLVIDDDPYHAFAPRLAAQKPSIPETVPDRIGPIVSQTSLACCGIIKNAINPLSVRSISVTPTKYIPITLTFASLLARIRSTAVASDCFVLTVFIFSFRLILSAPRRGSSAIEGPRA